MALVSTKRPVMTLYAGINDLYGHQVKIVLAEKGVSAEHVSLSSDDAPEVLAELNPYGTFPTLVDRDLVLFNASIILEYLDERFPHPPLLPIYPVARARARLMMYRIEREWYRPANILLSGAFSSEELGQAREDLLQSLLAVAKIFDESPYFLNDEFSLIDCVVAPLLFRLGRMKVSLPAAKAKPIEAYMHRVFNRDSFVSSLTEKDNEFRD